MNVATTRVLDMRHPPREHGRVPTVDEAAARARAIAAAGIRDLDAFVESFDQRTVDEAFVQLSDAVGEPDDAYDSAWTERFLAKQLLRAVSARRARAVLDGDL